MLLHMAEKIETRPVAALIPYAGNSRTHSKSQIKQIAASIKEFGFTNPVLISNDGDIVAGHGRVLAATLLGLDEVPCIDVGYLSEAQRRAYVIADNKLALNAGWDQELLAVELAGISDFGIDLDLVGFSSSELKNMGVGGLGKGGDASNEAPPSSWAVIVECDDEKQQVSLIERLQGEGLKVKGSIA